MKRPVTGGKLIIMDELGSPAATAGKSNESGAERFGRLLREELELAGLPTYQNIANRGGISKSAVSDAMRGVRIPSARTVLGIMAGLDRDPEPLLIERDSLLRLEATDGLVPLHSAGQVSEPGTGNPDRDHASGAANELAGHHNESGDQHSGQVEAPKQAGGFGLVPGHGRTRRLLSRKMALVLTGVLLAGITAGHVATRTLAANDGGDTRPAATGSNVLDTPCTKDGIVVASERRARDTQVEIVFSHDCKAMWGRVLRNDGRAFGNGMKAEFYPKGDPESELAQWVEVQDTSTALTALVIPPGTRQQFCLEASLTVDGNPLDLGDPLCI
ncbi:helix-turn-helix domain-containing protein [Paeniglutamicibacter sp. ORCA_105]|uniref:helix-turn-helix domain-containing protein n=1 Tax=Paeniglutamicibacter sp. ORCA_105 TaxID=3377336 RepID=UPI0038949824